MLMEKEASSGRSSGCTGKGMDRLLCLGVTFSSGEKVKCKVTDAQKKPTGGKRISVGGPAQLKDKPWQYLNKDYLEAISSLSMEDHGTAKWMNRNWICCMTSRAVTEGRVVDTDILLSLKAKFVERARRLGAVWAEQVGQCITCQTIADACVLQFVAKGRLIAVFGLEPRA